MRDYQDTTTYDFTRTDENLILYTCYPFDALGFTLTATLFMPATHPARSWMLTVEGGDAEMTQQKLPQRQRCVADGAFLAEQPDFGTFGGVCHAVYHVW